jgi:MbtH protein
VEQREDDMREYRVLINDEDQYSLWLASLNIPNEWTDTGVHGSKSECLKHIDAVWIDMRPKSLRVLFNV